MLAGLASTAFGAPGGGHGKPNGNPPIGQPVIKGDTDRGNSEGKGKSGIAGAHTVTTHAVITKLFTNSKNHKTTVVLRLPNGKFKTITVGNEAAENMRLRKGEPVIISETPGVSTPKIVVIKH
jgi:hypothetical protein